jgi:hypothetical protein
MLHHRLGVEIGGNFDDDNDDDNESVDNTAAQSWLLIDQLALQRYVLACCQDTFGGLFDKPGK